ncbi:DUF3958 family protein [Priestia taiwanensis]|uniref:DUF3958 domain-containing protein n=1 Tax=Priestia taiwanensis TaxID=1347902 RepID=A0A917ALV4_9BACI|nr:DUF3958 family protein [Priestia taiwanensis]MBM7362118.1 putative transcriptional regulator [Priestia taiwanensis]GGE59622.1 hypothetical protein GCM10007140_07420 [Priestia taiwanensis]
MNLTIEQKINKLDYQLRDISDEQYRNQLAIQKQKQTEKEFDWIKMQKNRLFEYILGTWQHDRELGSRLIDMQENTKQLERKLTYELEEQCNMLQKEKQSLIDQENDIYNKRYTLLKEVES